MASVTTVTSSKQHFLSRADCVRLLFKAVAELNKMSLLMLGRIENTEELGI